MYCHLDSSRLFAGDLILNADETVTKSYLLNVEMVEWPEAAGHCTDYTQLRQSHAQCMDQALEETLLPALGCLPPWSPLLAPSRHQQICQRLRVNASGQAAVDHVFTQGWKFMSCSHGQEFC